MKSLVFLLLLSLTFIFGCGSPEARRPVSTKTGSFFKTSVDRNKELLALEEEQIKNIIDSDTVNTYITSSNGYWYYYNTTSETEEYLPQTDDLIKITYDVKHLDNTIIYSKEEIGEQTIKVDKEELFPGLRTAVKLLKKGETATFLFPSAMAHGYHGDDNKIGVNVPLKSTVSLLDIVEKVSDSIIN